MPSWNIHIAQTERLLAGNGVVAGVVRDCNAFLFGNLVPDIYVGYMVPSVAEPVPYHITHFAEPEHIPRPREHEFWNTYVQPLFAQVSRVKGTAVPAQSIVSEREHMNGINYAQHTGVPASKDSNPAGPLDAPFTPDDLLRSTFDLTLGVWAHLLADNLWNTHVHQFLDEHGGVPNTKFRVKKQGDFEWFGKTLCLTLIPRASERLLAAAEAFAQYSIDRRYALEAVGVAHEIVRTNPGCAEHPPYQLLTEEFFQNTFGDVLYTTKRLLNDRLGAQI